jgi:hypothetical protein
MSGVFSGDVVSWILVPNVRGHKGYGACLGRDGDIMLEILESPLDVARHGKLHGTFF